MRISVLVLIVFGLSGSLLGSAEDLSIAMVKIPGATFRMGSESGRIDEKPVHSVHIGAFFLGKTEVTVGQFRNFVKESGYRTEAERGNGSVVFTGRKWDKKSDANWRRPGFSQDDSHPVTCVSWNDCQEFIQWLNARTGRHYRLPTEAEWEYAAGNGGKESGRVELDSHAWFEGNSADSTHPVGRKQSNTLGLYDMIGNVWEWCSDWYGSYSSTSQTDPPGPGGGSMHINRGGAWYGASGECLTRRGKNTPDDRGHGLGFRLAADTISK